MSNEKAAVQKTENKAVIYEVGGEKIVLSINTVLNYLARGDENVTEQEVVLFMNWCKYNYLNPWNNEAYLVKYDKTKPAQNITAKGAFMRRAEEDPLYDGFKAGLIVGRDGTVQEIEGSFMLKTDTLLGGWCDVYRKDRKFPVSARVNLEEYNTGKSTWSKMPKTMIRKVAIVQALREAFPAKLQSLYTEEEFQDAEVVNEEKKVTQEIEDNANKKPVRFELPDTKPIVTMPNTKYEQQEEMIVLGDEGDGQMNIMGPDF